MGRDRGLHRQAVVSAHQLCTYRHVQSSSSEMNQMQTPLYTVVSLLRNCNSTTAPQFIVAAGSVVQLHVLLLGLKMYIYSLSQHFTNSLGLHCYRSWLLLYCTTSPAVNCCWIPWLLLLLSPLLIVHTILASCLVRNSHAPPHLQGWTPQFGKCCTNNCCPLDNICYSIENKHTALHNCFLLE